MNKEDSICPICKQSLDTKHITIYDADWKLITGEEKIKSIICGNKKPYGLFEQKALNYEKHLHAEKAAAYRAEHCPIGGSEENRVVEQKAWSVND